jgi:hypothetical protein
MTPRRFSPDKGAAAILALLLVISRYTILDRFNFRYVTNDEMIFWQAARDYSQGLFYEPYFYGQNYNFMLEALLAVPLILLSIPYEMALPAVSTVLAVFPFLFFAFIMFRRGHTTAALFTLFTPLALPVEYDMLTSMTRGFVSGIFFCGPLVIALVRPHEKRSWVIAALSASLGIVFNPNSIVVSLPVCLYLLGVNYMKPMFYAILLPAAAPAFILEHFARKFYETHPGFNLHPAWVLTYDYERALSNFNVLDNFFACCTPVFWFAGWLVLPLIVTAGIILLKRDKLKGAVLIASVVFILFTLGINKVNDDLSTIFLSSARMYLGIPLLSCVAFLWIFPQIKLSGPTFRNIIVASAATVFCVKLSILKPVVSSHLTRKNYVAVAVREVEKLRGDCRSIGRYASELKADQVVFVANWIENVAEMEFYNYGCPLFDSSFPPTVLPAYERRNWVYEEARRPGRKNILVYGWHFDAERIKYVKDVEVITAERSSVLLFRNVENPDSVLRQINSGFLRN